jgi:small subunit ribosomal protein S16
VAVKIRLTRIGLKKQPTYRIVVKEEHSKRDGAPIENLGYYNPRTEPATIVLNEARTRYWLGVGAQPSDAMGIILKTAGITDKFYRPRAPRKPKHKEEAASAAAPAPTAEAPAAQG